MAEKDRPARDVFSFSLRGMSVIPGFVVLPLIADDRIRKRFDESRREPRDAHGDEESSRSNAGRARSRRAA